MRNCSQCQPAWTLVALVTCLALALPGCGGGSSGGSGSNGGGGTGGNSGGGGSTDTSQPSYSTVSGSVTDEQGAPIVGATVSLGSLTTTSSQVGAYTLPNATVAVGQVSLITRIVASATLNGKAYSGSNIVHVLRGNANTQNMHIVLSPTATQGSISGTVQDNQAKPITNAQVVAAVFDPTKGTYSYSLGSFFAVTDQNGHYTLPNLPPTDSSVKNAPYTVTAFAYSHNNQTVTTTVTASKDSNASFSLPVTSTGSTLGAVSTFSASTITEPSSISRAAGVSSGLNALKNFILARKGLLGHRLAATAKVYQAGTGMRSSPAGSLIETDLFWDYQAIPTLLGYSINRSDVNDTSFKEVAVMLDPLSNRYSEIDSALTPDTIYYYAVARVDTINYPVNGNEGAPSFVASVEPMGALSLAQPPTKSTQGTTPTFSWTTVNRAANYQILVYDRFPDYQSDTSVDGVKPIWPADPTAPGASLVTAPNTTLFYSGPALQSGHTYYWAVVATDSVNSAYSVSPIYSFTVQ